MRFRALAFVSMVLALGTARVPTLRKADPPRTLVLTPVREPTVRVLMFHQIARHPIEPKTGIGTPWMTPQRFAELLGALSRRGYHFITMQTAIAYLSEKMPASHLPHRSVTLTFDDGYRSAWRDATPILRRYHATATMFFEGHATGVIRGRLTDADLRAMARSGIWSLQSHGYAGHSDLVVGPHGERSPYWYANLQWLAKKHRFESIGEFERRVRDDLLRFRRTFEPVTGARIDLFAYPSGEYGQNAALPRGANPLTNVQAGHSNASGLTPALFRALESSGFTAAFAVYDPGHVHFASRSDDIYALPRIGFAASASIARDLQAMQSLESKGIEFPEIDDGNYTAVAPIAVEGMQIYAASTTEPILYLLNRYGRRIARYYEPELYRGRAAGAAAIGAIALVGQHLWVFQQAGAGARSEPYLSEFSLAHGAPVLESRRTLPKAMSWLVGLAPLGGRLYGIDDGGAIFDLKTGRQVGALDRSQTYQSGRFAGLAAGGDALVTYDRKTNRLLYVNPTGELQAFAVLHGDVRSLALEGNRLFVSRWGTARHMLRIYTIGARNTK